MENIVILCGGLGTRVQHITLNKPKLLIDINGKPFFYHTLKILKKNKIKNIFLLTQHKDKYIKNYIKNINQFSIKVLRDGKKRLGTGGSLKKNLKYVGENFAFEARSIHYNSKNKNFNKGIYGKASNEEIKDLKQEGIETQTIPWIEDKEN